MVPPTEGRFASDPGSGTVVGLDASAMLAEVDDAILFAIPIQPGWRLERVGLIVADSVGAAVGGEAIREGIDGAVSVAGIESPADGSLQTIVSDAIDDAKEGPRVSPPCHDQPQPAMHRPSVELRAARSRHARPAAHKQGAALMNCHPSKREFLARLIVSERHGMSVSSPSFWSDVAEVRAELEREAASPATMSSGVASPALARAPVFRTAEEAALLTPALCRRLGELGMTEDEFLRYYRARPALATETPRAGDEITASHRRILGELGMTVEEYRKHASKAGTDVLSQADIGPLPRTADEITASQRRINRRLGISDEALLKGSAIASARWTGTW